MLQRYSMGRESISPRMPGKLDSGKTVESNYTNMLSVPPEVQCQRRNPALRAVRSGIRECPAGQKGDLRRRRNGEGSAASVVDLRKAMIINEFMAVEAFDPKERRENVLKHLHSGFESFENLMNDAGPSCRSALRTSTPLPFPPSQSVEDT